MTSAQAMIILAVSLSVIIQWPIHASAQDSIRSCYWNNGSTTLSTGYDYRSCDANGPNGVSQCCLIGEACLSNGLCFGSRIGLEYRGACTDKSWSQNTTACPRYCSTGKPSGWANMLPCPGYAHQPQIWCSSSSSAQPCTSGESGELYEYTPGNIMFIVNDTDIAASGSSPSLESGSSTSSPASGNPTSSHTDGSAAEASGGGVSSAHSCVASSVPIGVGVGIGIPLLLACSVLGWLLVRERRSRNQGRGGYLEAVQHPDPIRKRETRQR